MCLKLSCYLTYLGLFLPLLAQEKKEVWLETVLSCQLRLSVVCAAQCSMQCLLQTKYMEVLLILAAPFAVKPEENARRIFTSFLFSLKTFHVSQGDVHKPDVSRTQTRTQPCFPQHLVVVQ